MSDNASVGGDREPLPCLDCHRPLTWSKGMLVVYCACGLAYSVDLLLSADDEVWEYVREHRSFRRDGNTVWMNRSDLPGDLIRPGPPSTHSLRTGPAS